MFHLTRTFSRDVQLIRDISGRILTKCGYTVLLAEDGESAADLFRKEHGRIDLVILDISMPRMSGDKVFHILRQTDPEARIMLMSGFKQDRRVKRIDSALTAGFIQKPFSMNQLSSAVYDIIMKTRP